MKPEPKENFSIPAFISAEKLKCPRVENKNSFGEVGSFRNADFYRKPLITAGNQNFRKCGVCHMPTFIITRPPITIAIPVNCLRLSRSRKRTNANSTVMTGLAFVVMAVVLLWADLIPKL